MPTERESALLWLPATFVLEVLAWEVGSRVGLGIVDPTWEEFGRSLEIERITWGLGGVVVVLFVLFMVLSKRRSTAQISWVQFAGVLALVAYWIGASVVATGAVVTSATVAAMILSGRRDG